MAIKEFLDDFFSIVFPSNCISCTSVLLKNENHLCLFCRHALPVTNDHIHPNPILYQKFWGKIKIEYAFSFLKFVKGNITQKILFHIKYKDQIDLATEMGERYGHILAAGGFDKKFDLIIPVPLHKYKFKKRGYNQSEVFAAGMASVLKIPLDESVLIRTVDTVTQTNKNRIERWFNVENIFVIKNPEAIKGLHVLLIDDVITTGATLISCAEVLLQNGASAVSIASLAYAE